MRAAAVLALGLALAAGRMGEAAALPPEVGGVEPPGWWPGHSLDPLRLLVRGRNLGGAEVEAAGPGLEARPARVSEAGTYLFLDLHIDPAASPGPRRIRIRTAGGGVEVPFDLLPPLARGGRFQGFSPDDVIYLALPDRFANGDPANDDPPVSKGLFDRKKARYYHGGDLQGLIDHLPYLKDLGVTALWLTPWYDNANRLNERERYNGEAITDYHGYGATDFYAVEEHFGTLAKLKELVEAAHGQGIKVIQDQVANHTGPYHPWVSDSPTPTWFNGTEASHLANTWQTWTLEDPHAPPEMQRATLEGWFLDILPDLNQDDPETARYLIQNTLWWVGMTGLDGIRQDTVPYVPRRFWRDWMGAIKREYPGLRVVGELFDGDPALVSFFQGGKERFDGIDSGLDTLFDFPLYYKIREAFAGGKPLKELALVLAHDHLYRDPAPLVTFLGLHDLPRFMNEPGASVRGLQEAFTFLLTSRGTPLVYYGDEIGMPGGADPDNRRDFPGGWKDDARSAFVAAGRSPDEQAVFAHLRRLLHLRKELRPLRRGSLVTLALGERAWVYARIADGEPVLVVLNNGEGVAEIDAPAGPPGLSEGALLEDRLGAAPEVRVKNGRLRFTLPGWSGAIYTRKATPGA
jgi:glycosidase